LLISFSNGELGSSAWYYNPLVCFDPKSFKSNDLAQKHGPRHVAILQRSLAHMMHFLFRQGCLLPMPVPKLRKNAHTEPIDFLPPDEVVFGRSAKMMELKQRAAKVCGTTVPVLLQGDGGTGKEVLARWIHKHSAYRNGQFVKVNCAAIPGTLLESELFGYEKGAFTGAYALKPGRVELAHQGTLFLDEIADLDLGLQSKLMHFLQDGRFSRIGDEAERVVETRLICATNKDLDHEIDLGRFRADLYYRINVVCLRLPRLCERGEDIPQLAEYFLLQFQQKFEKKADSLSEGMMRYLRNLDWPGNIRELSNGIARYVLIGPDANIAQEPIVRQPNTSQANHFAAGTTPLKQIAKEAIRDRERNYILKALEANRWNRRKTAKELKISYRALIYKIRNVGLLARGGENLSTGPEETVDPSHS
jgi:two-component system, NtrC family, response regulator AtoC